MTSFGEAIPVLKQVPQSKKENYFAVPDDYPEKLQPIRLTPNWRKATLLTAGENDNRTPVWVSEKSAHCSPQKKRCG